MAVVQTLLNIFYDGPNGSLQQFSASLGLYVKQVAEYVGYVSEEKPFPFSEDTTGENIGHPATGRLKLIPYNAVRWYDGRECIEVPLLTSNDTI